MKNYTIVSGLWDLNREGRKFEEHYIPRFKEFLKIEANMILFVPASLEKLVWEHRNPDNTFVKIFELEDIKKLYGPHWDKTQEIRTNSDWYNLTGEGGWLKNSPQASLEYYNPIVQSKMFMLHDAVCYNNFETDYYFWVDAGLTNTVPATHLGENNCLDYLTECSNPFLFLSYPYDANDEIHGFKYPEMNEIAGKKVKYVCRGGLFGGHKEQIREANSTYYALLTQTLERGLMGTEESIFSIMAHKEPNLYRRFELDGNGLVVKFTEALVNKDVKLVDIPKNSKLNKKVSIWDLKT